MIPVVRYDAHSHRNGPPKISTKLTLSEEEEILRSVGVPVPQRRRWIETDTQSQPSQYAIENGHIIRLRLRLDSLNEDNGSVLCAIGALTSLIELDLSHNDLEFIPPEICRLSRLQILNLSENKLTFLPVEIGNLVSLTILDLHSNQLTTLPDTLGQLSNLKEFNLSSNKLAIIPESLGSLALLTSLDLRHNQLTSLPASLASNLKKNYSLTIFQ